MLNAAALEKNATCFARRCLDVVQNVGPVSNRTSRWNRDLQVYWHKPDIFKSTFMKRFFDIVLILITAWLWLPVMLITGLLVLCFLGSPGFFVQKRPGLNGRPFRLIKFRTMLAGDAGDVHRLNRFGRFLRALSLDELPELINVLKGDMSLVGPRPLLMRYLPRYSEHQMHRHDLRPGITGWAQVNGRNLLSWEEKFEHDLWYVENRSLWLDTKILFMTLGKVVKREGISGDGEATKGEFMGDD